MIDLNKHVVKVELIDYFDVWGDPINGWQVNNQCSEWCGYIPEEVFNSREKMLLWLKDGVAFLNTTDPDLVELECPGPDAWYINAADNGQPLGAVYALYGEA